MNDDTWYTSHRPLYFDKTKDIIDLYPAVIKHGNGKYTIQFGELSIETPISTGFPLAMVDYCRVHIAYIVIVTIISVIMNIISSEILHP